MRKNTLLYKWAVQRWYLSLLTTFATRIAIFSNSLSSYSVDRYYLHRHIDSIRFTEADFANLRCRLVQFSDGVRELLTYSAFVMASIHWTDMLAR